MVEFSVWLRVLPGKRELFASLCLSSKCFVIVTVPGLFLTVSWVDLQCVIVVFPNHNRLLFWKLHLFYSKGGNFINQMFGM